jgi:hypothetical protein
MNLKSRRRYGALICIKGFRAQHAEAAAKPAAAVAFDAVDAAIAEVELLASGRLHGTNTFLSASAERQAARAELHEFISDLSRISKTLPRALYPDIAEQLRMGRLNAYQDLLSLARNAIVAITPIKQVFMDHGAPETVTEDIQSLIDALERAANRRNRGLGSQIATNTSLRIAARKAMDQVRILDGILTITLKRQPGLLAEWKSAMCLRRSGKSTPPESATAAPVSISEPEQPPAQSKLLAQPERFGSCGAANDSQETPDSPVEGQPPRKNQPENQVRPHHLDLNSESPAALLPCRSGGATQFLANS